MKNFFLLFLVFYFCYSFPAAFGQNRVDVNPLTGTVGVAIPVYQIKKGNVSVPVTLVYGGRGIKPKDVESSAGIGFYLSAGGQISREVRGLPDDCQKDNSGNDRLGWLYNNNGTSISNFTIANDNNGSTCTDESTNINYINTNFTGYSDTEPDIFNVSAPGLSCQLVLDKSHVFRTVSYQDLKVEYTTGLNGIYSFTITNNKGTKYVFASPELINRKAIGTAVTYFTNTYKQYQYGINFFNNWYLTSITDANGNTVSLSYTNGPDRTSNDPVELFISGSTTKSTQFTIQDRSTQQTVSSITNGTDQLIFNWQSNYYSAGGTDISYIGSITGMGRSFQFTYSTVSFVRSDNSSYNRAFLRGVNDSGCSSPVSYNFTYYGETMASPGSYTTVLSDSSSTYTDYWGYFNTNNSTSTIPAVYVNPTNQSYPRYENYTYPNSNGTDYSVSLGVNGKYVAPNSITAGSLKTITNANGGVTTIVYESNDYLDVPSNTISPGNGIRVSRITDNDGISSANDIVRNYSYLDPATGKSSGRATTLPVFAFTIPYTGTATGSAYWNNATVLSPNDLSNDDHAILYKYCKETTAGAGSTLYQYYVTATQWDSNATPGCSLCTTAEWARTVTNIARPTCTAYGPIKDDIYTYPFPPAANYDTERGLIQKVTNYNDAGIEVSETAYTYQRTGSPLVIQALKFDDNNGVKAFAKYNIFATTSELTSQVTKKVFDSPTLSQAQSNTTNFTYDNTYHQLIKQQITNSDNSIVSINTNYSKNYTIAAPGADSTVNAIYHLQKQNINLPIESYTQVTRGSTTKTVTAQLTKFKTVAFPGNTYAYLPFQSLKLVSADGASFTPFAISGGTAVYDPKYIPVTNFTAYDNAGILQTADDNYKHVQTSITDHFSNYSVALFKNASVGEVCFEDFDSSLPSGTNFTLSAPAGVVNTNSHTGNSYTFSTGQTISKAMSRKTGESYYTFSAWISSSGSGTINLTLTNSSNASSTYNESFTNTSNKPKYFEWKVPVNNMTTNFTMSFGTSQSVYIDDILFYPQSAEAITSAYEPVGHYKIAETNTNGISTYYANDKFGRVLVVYDQDKYIKERKSYLNSDDVAAGLASPMISTVPSYTTGAIDVNTVVNMDAGRNPCISDATFTWNFGDGATVSALNGYSQTHTYTATGNYTVTCTVSSPSYGNSISSSQNLVIKYPNLSPIICQSGVTMWDNCYHKSLNQVDCAPNPNDATHSYYTIVSVGGSGYGTLHYQWQLSYDNGATWLNDGTDAAQFIKNCAPKNQAYRVRCIVTSSVGQTGGTSDYALFDVVNCQ
jgi:hypothetical protein